MKEKQPTILCVLGMHRSGTSAAARMLNLLGVDLGPQDMLVEAADDNPTGFWECRPIVEINQLILSTLGGSAMDPPLLRPGWERDPALDGLRVKAREMVMETFGDKSLWAWKDPRACITLRFWKELLPRMKYVVCLRRPSDVASSLGSRDRIGRKRSIYLWLLHNREVLAETLSEERHLMTYEGALNAPLQTAMCLARFAGLEHRLEDGRVQEALTAFIDPARRHHSEPRLSAHEGSESPPLSPSDFADLAYFTASRSTGLDQEEIISIVDAGLDSVRSEGLPPVRNRRETRRTG